MQMLYRLSYVGSESDARSRRAPTAGLQRVDGAGNGARTRDPQLGRLMLYQLSYSRSFVRNLARRRAVVIVTLRAHAGWWGGEDSNLRSLSATDLQICSL